MRRSRKWDDVDSLLKDAVAGGIFPGAVLAVIEKGKLCYLKPHGFVEHGSREKVKPDAVYDVASLTKPICTAMSFLSMVADGSIRLDLKVKDFFGKDELSEALKEVEIFDLLSHCSGLPAWTPFYKKFIDDPVAEPGTAEAKLAIYDMVRHSPLAYERGSRHEYSDLGFILLSEIAERIDKSAFEEIVRKRVFFRFRMENSSYILWKLKDAKGVFPGSQVVPTEKSPFLKEATRGIVHDENCYCMGGVSGHAGLFTTAQDISVFAEGIIAAWHGASDVFSKGICGKFFIRRNYPHGSPWALGWKTPSDEDRSMGSLFPALTIGHLGFTGCSLWIDLEAKRGVILISNRVNPTRENIKIREFRPLVHDLLMEKLKE